jgi:ketosteroid isomerase-like protein
MHAQTAPASRTAANKQLLQNVFEALAKGDSRPFVDAMDDDFRWIMTGTTAWSGSYEGKQIVVSKLFGAMRAKIADRILTVPRRIVADGDLVVVEARGNNVTRDGKPYCNSYCFVFRLADGRLKELVEYFDTELVTSALGEPAFPAN